MLVELYLLPENWLISQNVYQERDASKKGDNQLSKCILQSY